MRTEVCLRPFNNYINISHDQFPTEYFNNNLKENVDLTVADFYWACSRKSYLPCGQTNDVCSYDAILKCLRAGARLINIDIYRADDSEKPVVRNSTTMPYYGNALNLDKVFMIISKYAWMSASNYPLIIYMTINTNDPSVLKQIAVLIMKYFKNNLIDKKYSFNGRNGMFPISQMPIKDCVSKVIFITDKYPTIGTLDEFVNSVISSDQQYIQKIDYTEETNQYGGLRSQKVDGRSLINYNRQNITLIDPIGKSTMTNIHNPKIDLINPEPKDCWDFGCQFVLMNYQLYDDNMKNYYNKFKNAGLILKPESLRYIKKPPVKIEKQERQNYFGPKTLSRKGWFSINF